MTQISIKKGTRNVTLKFKKNIEWKLTFKIWLVNLLLYDSSFRHLNRLKLIDQWCYDSEICCVQNVWYVNQSAVNCYWSAKRIFLSQVRVTAEVWRWKLNQSTMIKYCLYASFIYDSLKYKIPIGNNMSTGK